MPKRKKYQRIGKFRVETYKNEFDLLTNRPERGHVIYNAAGVKVGKYSLSKKEQKIENKLKRYIKRIYSDNEKMLQEKGITSSNQFQEYMYDLMYERRFDETGAIASKPRSVKESLRILSRTRAFTSKEELALENMKNIVARGKNPEIRAELAQYFGNKGGQIQWKKLEWHPAIKVNGRVKEPGYYTIPGVNVKLTFRKKKKGKYNFEELFDISPL